MARIKGKQRHRTVKVPSARHLDLEWLPLAVAFGGFALVVGAVPADDPAFVPLGGVLLAVGAYLLGRRHGQAAPDPQARGRVTQLERTLLQLTVLLGNDGLAGSDQRAPASAQGRQPRPDASAHRGAGRTDHDGPTIEGRDFDDPLPGEA